MKNVRLARLNKRAAYGEFTPSGDGEPTEVWHEVMTLFYGSYKQTLKDVQQLSGEGSGEVKVIIIRHNERVTNSGAFQINGKQYNVKQVLPDDDVNGMDLVTLEYEE
ncbi:phage head closure protein [Schleiferilactobacillus harbinensis]|jgi:SPP1 family predicted phage head-tail adaptor|uniref:Phage head closure protein n=1 Tax=Schleiferilactobacillus harbinensis TaxID=304207 RepID=A0ABU7SVB2_9LACO